MPIEIDSARHRFPRASPPPLCTVAATGSTEHLMTEEVIQASDLMPGWRIPAGSNDIPRSLAPWQARRITAHINANLDTALRVEDLARIARLSESYFARAFCSSFGCPPHRFVTLCRLGRAKELMLKADTSLRQIATDCGFADQAHFSRIFLRFVGVSPARWRRALAAPPAAE